TKMIIHVYVLIKRVSINYQSKGGAYIVNKKMEQLEHHVTDNQRKHALTTNQGVKIAEDEFSSKNKSSIRARWYL
ncbi:hypothetical protein ACT453_27505, partial [Bacillus sp. D-CC]